MTSYECLQMLATKITDELFVTTFGRIAREWHHLKHRDGNFYRVHLSATTSYALGLAVALPHRRVISLDGDASMLMGQTILPAIAHKNPTNLIVIVFDNELYEASSGDRLQNFTAGKTDLAQIARGAGIANSRTVRDLREFKEAVDHAFQADGPTFITAKVKRPAPGTAQTGPWSCNYLENKHQFIRYIEKTENVQIIKPAYV
jgi:sulfopyruvate decarboxylase subunit beta